MAHQRSLEVRETCLDPDDPSIARSLQLQADLHAQSGKLMTAEMLYRQSLDIYEASLGKTHPHVSHALYSLAVFYQKQGKLVVTLSFTSTVTRNSVNDDAKIALSQHALLQGLVNVVFRARYKCICLLTKVVGYWTRMNMNDQYSRL